MVPDPKSDRLEMVLASCAVLTAVGVLSQGIPDTMESFVADVIFITIGIIAVLALKPYITHK